MSDEKSPDAIETRPDDPPVVARLVVEIRSDGTRTIARGAMEDRTTGETVMLETSGTTPAALAASMLAQLQKLPAFATAQAVRQVAARGVKSALRRLLPGAKA